jgi:hypothetical protein
VPQECGCIRPSPAPAFCTTAYLVSQPALATSQPSPAHRQRPRSQPGPERRKSATLRLPGAVAGSPHGSPIWRASMNLFDRPLCLRAFVVWSVVAGYNCQLIVIENRRHCFPNPVPGKTPRPEASTPDIGPARPLPPSASAYVHAGPPGGHWPWPRMALPASDSTDAARGLWQKFVLFSSELRGFAPSREPVITARPAPRHRTRALARQSSPP